MTNMIKAELYRISHRRSTYIFFLVLFLIYTSIMISTGFITGNDNFITPYMLDNAVKTSFKIGTIIISINAYITIYADDISSGYIKHIISKSSHKLVYILAKFIALSMYVFISYLILGGIFYAEMYIFSSGFYSNIAEYMPIIRSSIYFAFIACICTVIYAMSGSLVLYFSSKSSFGSVWIALFTSSVISGFIQLIAYFIGVEIDTVSDYFIDNILASLIEESFNLNKFIVLIFYLIASIILQIAFINRRELKLN